MSATFETLTDPPTLVVTGEIDLANAGQLDAALAALPEGSAVTVDLSAVTYLDSAGVKVLFNHAQPGPLRVVLAPDSLVATAVSASRLDQVADVEMLPVRS